MFFDIEKANYMIWKDGLLIKLNKMGIGGIIFMGKGFSIRKEN